MCTFNFTAQFELFLFFFSGKMHIFEFLGIKRGFGENVVVQSQKGQQRTGSTSHSADTARQVHISHQAQEPVMLSPGPAAPRGKPHALGLS